MVRRLLPLILLTGLLAACGGHQMAECKGPAFAMNATQWQPTADDLKCGQP